MKQYVLLTLFQHYSTYFVELNDVETKPATCTILSKSCYGFKTARSFYSRFAFLFCSLKFFGVNRCEKTNDHEKGKTT